MEKKIKICFVNSSNPNFLGGVSLYQKNLISFISKKRFDITWVYQGNSDRNYKKNGINYVEIKVPGILFWNQIVFNLKAKKFLEKAYFDIINSHAVCGYWIKEYKKQKKQKIIHTYHGLAVPYYKTHLKRFGLIKRLIYSLLLLPYSYFIEKPPMKKCDKIICVSEKVKNQTKKVYGKRKNIFVIRTGVNRNKFKQKNKNKVKEELGLKKNFIYGLYVGKGGYWIKGLDRAVKVSEEIHKKNKDFRLIILGADILKKGIKNLIKKEFIIYKKEVNRKQMPYYYSACDILFCLSRYEGGAPTLVVSEAMASGCLIISSKSSKQEIIEDGKNGLIIDNCDEGISKKDLEKILDISRNKNIKYKIIKEAIKTIKEISLNKWGKKYLEVLTK